MKKTFNDRTPIYDAEAAQAYRAEFTDERPKCEICGAEIELFLDLRNEFPDARLYWAHAFGIIPEHKALASD